MSDGDLGDKIVVPDRVVCGPGGDDPDGNPLLTWNLRYRSLVISMTSVSSHAT